MAYNVAILGASGYTGAELVRLLAHHPEFRLAALCADRKAGQTMFDVYPQFYGLDLPVLTKIDEVDFTQIDLVFAALPHGLSQAIVKDLPTHVKVVDLGADFRLRDPEQYEFWYNAPHCATELQKTAVYGLTEFYRSQIKEARLVAGTGCNAATVQYALRPLIEHQAIDLDDIICDLKNGLTGAGRATKEHMLFTERSGSVAGYAQGGKHRHLGEFDQEFSAIVGRPVKIQFTPHLVPVNRGILASAYLKGDAKTCHRLLQDTYKDEPFVKVLPFDVMPDMAHVAGSNFCYLGVTSDRISGRVLVVSTLDNLCKGSSGQALQNANLLFGLDETLGLSMMPIFP